MSMPSMPEINHDITRDYAINTIIMSIAMEELAIAHILNAEGEKLQYALGTLDKNNPVQVSFCDVMAVNESIRMTLREVVKAEMILQYKLENAIELEKNGDE